MFLASSIVFLDPGELREDDFHLVLQEKAPAMSGRSPAYRFQIRRITDGVKLGRIELRISHTEDVLLYVGHIGYHVDQPYRGQHYAARACRLLLDLARRHDFKELWITCDPDNFASRRTCELAGGTFVSIVAVPEEHPFYKAGSHAKCRYRVELSPVGEC